MATSNEKRQAFKINIVFPAVVTKVQSDRVFFSISREVKVKAKRKTENEKDVVTIKESAAFFIKGHQINPHQVFRKGQKLQVVVDKLCSPSQNLYGLCYVVTPEFLPSDAFVANHPVDSMVEGVIEKVTGETMLVMLAKNVYAVTKRCKHAKSGLPIKCKIDKYKDKKISLRTFV